MAKKKSSSWLVPEETTKEAAKEVIKKTVPKSKSGREEGNTRGPLKQEEAITRVAVKASDRKKLKALASLKGMTIIEYFTDLVEEAWQKRND